MTLFLAFTGFLILTVAFMGWRAGVAATLVAGFAQELLRKYVPGEPVYLTAVVVVVFAAAFLGAVQRGLPLSLRPIFASHPPLRRPTTLFLILCILQLGATFVRTGSPQLVAIGVISYLAPIAGLVFAFSFGLRWERIERFLGLYLALTIVMGASVYLDVLGFDWRALESVGTGLVVYTRSAGALELPTGFYRAAEPAAWHSAAGLAVLAMLVAARRWRFGTWTAAGAAVLLLGAVLLTGRRKALVAIVLFVLLFGLLLTVARRGAKKLFWLLLAGSVAAALAMAVLVPGEERAGYEPYLERTQRVVGEAGGRFRLMTWGLLGGAIYDNGLLGSGAGTGGGGAQYFGGGVNRVGGGAEGGLGKIAAELGVLGLALAIWIAVTFTRRGLVVLRAEREGDPRMALVDGFAAWLLVNAILFATASQIFGDPLVLIVLGFLSGFVLSAPVRSQLERELAASRHGAFRATPRAAGPWTLGTRPLP